MISRTTTAETTVHAAKTAAPPTAVKNSALVMSQQRRGSAGTPGSPDRHPPERSLPRVDGPPSHVHWF